MIVDLRFNAVDGSPAPRWTKTATGLFTCVSNKLSVRGDGSSGGFAYYTDMYCPGGAGRIRGRYRFTAAHNGLYIILGANVTAAPAYVEIPNGGMAFHPAYSDGLIYLKNMDAGLANVTSAAFSHNTTDVFEFIFQRIGRRFQIKVWNATSGVEPIKWNIDYLSSSHAGERNNRFAIARNNSSSTNKVNFDWLQFDDLTTKQE